MDPRGVGTVQIELNATLAELLARLCVELSSDHPSSEEDGGEDHLGVLSRALGLLDLAMKTRRQGGRLCFVNDRGETADVVF